MRLVSQPSGADQFRLSETNHDSKPFGPSTTPSTPLAPPVGICSEQSTAFPTALQRLVKAPTSAPAAERT